MPTTIGRVHGAHRQARNRGAEPRRGLCAVGIFRILALGILVAPRTAAAQHHGNIPLVGEDGAKPRLPLIRESEQAS
jgi:hypothetical protein